MEDSTSFRRRQKEKAYDTEKDAENNHERKIEHCISKGFLLAQLEGYTTETYAFFFANKLKLMVVWLPHSCDINLICHRWKRLKLVLWHIMLFTYKRVPGISVDTKKKNIIRFFFFGVPGSYPLRAIGMKSCQAATSSAAVMTDGIRKMRKYHGIFKTLQELIEG